MACLSLLLPTLARCERPSGASESASSDQPGRFEQGPEEKWVLFGRTSGFAVFAMMLSFQIDGPSLGKGVPRPGIFLSAFTVKRVMALPDKFLSQLSPRGHAKGRP